MPQYVPYYTIVPQPGTQFLREFGSNTPMGNRDMDSGEFGRLAQTDWSQYHTLVNGLSLSHSFYHRAPNEPHWIVTSQGEQKYLKGTAELSQFYNNLPANEKQKIIQEKSPLAQLIK